MGKQLIDAGAQKKKCISSRPLKDADGIQAYVALWHANHQISQIRGDLFHTNFIISKIYCFSRVLFKR